RAYTAGDAYSVLAEQKRGKLAPGYLADIVVLDHDLTRIKPEMIQDVQVVMTIVGGKTMYTRQ
ncbi:MAG TPA: amidohydrolase family protein, partial [Gemmatimonadales bacterium]|nr:amidohydrolase family protein [Gemmatimonadales bacterium]